MSVRVRYAPSPTGLQHIGGVRTALFNYLFARSSGGSFILRIEDTDQQRFSEEALKDLYETLDWFGIRCDEGPDVGGACGPYIQSHRFDIYQEYARKLLDSGHAYRCWCTAERLTAVREKQEQEKSSYKGYDRHCRDLTAAQQEEMKRENPNPVVRLKIPLDGSTSFSDMLMGEITRKNSDINPDPVLMKSDGYPTYHLANVVDDHLMEITHILRAQEWIPSGPLHVLLYRAFGWDPPVYCHLPMVMGKDGQKLSKRHGSTAVREFREQGYLSEAMINYISLLGWSFDDKREFFTLQELEELFSLDKINKAPGVFDYKKLEWFNGQYIRMKDARQLKEMLIPYLVHDQVVDNPPSPQQLEILDQAMPLIQERLHLLNDVSEMTRFLFCDIPAPPADQLIPKKHDASSTAEILSSSLKLLEPLDDDSVDRLEQEFREFCTREGIKLGAVLMPLRVAVTGSTISPPLFESMKLLGKEKTLSRIEAAIDQLRQKEQECDE